MVVGEDRIREFEVLLNKYNGKKARHGFYNFKSINIVSAGARDPDATGVEGMSASKQRDNASKNDFVTFSQGVPKTMSNKDARKLFNDVRTGMGDTVVVKENDELVKVAVLGANYVIIERTDGTRLRKWIDAVELIEKGSGKKQDPDIKDREGTQPARYHTGLKKSTKAKRDAHFKKHGKKDDDDSSAYKPAPGDATAKTKPSKYTKAFKDMYNEAKEKEVHVRMDNLGKDEDKVVDILQKYEKKGVLKFYDNTDKGVIFKLLKPAMLSGLNRELKRFYTDAQLSEGVEFSFEMCLNAETTPQMLRRWMSKTIQKKQYSQVADYIKKQMEKDNNRHSPEYYASELVRKHGLKLDVRALGKMVKNEETDPVKNARADIEREKEADKKKHDKILDRARLARAKAKNRETK
jgi:hypothetical protein